MTHPVVKLRLMVRAYQETLDYIDRWDRDLRPKEKELGMAAALNAAAAYDANPIKAKSAEIEKIEAKIKEEEQKIKGWNKRIAGAVSAGDYESAAQFKRFIGWSEAEIAEHRREVEFIRGN